MSRIRKINLSPDTIFANTTAEVFFPVTGWMLAGGITKARASFEVRGFKAADTSVAPAYQLSDVENSLSTTDELATFVTSNGNTYPTAFNTQIGTDAVTKQNIRFGWTTKNNTTAGASTVVVRVMGRIEVVED